VWGCFRATKLQVLVGLMGLWWELLVGIRAGDGSVWQGSLLAQGSALELVALLEWGDLSGRSPGRGSSTGHTHAGTPGYLLDTWSGPQPGAPCPAATRVELLQVPGHL